MTTNKPLSAKQAAKLEDMEQEFDRLKAEELASAPIVEVGSIAGIEAANDKIEYPEMKEATGGVLAEVANTQQDVVYSWQEQADPNFHKKLAKDSLRAQEKTFAELAEQNERYMTGQHEW